jgi:hypothetical protein
MDPLSISFAVLGLLQPAIQSFKTLCGTINSYRGASKYAKELKDQFDSFDLYLERSETWLDENKEKLNIETAKKLQNIMKNLQESITECSKSFGNPRFKNNFVKKLAETICKKDFVKDLIFAVKGEGHLKKLLENIKLWIEHIKLHTMESDRRGMVEGLEKIDVKINRFSEEHQKVISEMQVILEKMENPDFKPEEVEKEIETISDKTNSKESEASTKNFYAGNSINWANQGFNEIGTSNINHYHSGSK